MPVLTAKHVRLHRSPEDGTRLLVMRTWPRGVRKDHVDEWVRDLAPSPALLAEYKERMADLGMRSVTEEFWSWFKTSYHREMSVVTELISELRVRHEGGEVITLLCVCHDPRRCHRGLLGELILGEPGGGTP